MGAVFCFRSILPHDKQPRLRVLLAERQLQTPHILLIFRCAHGTNGRCSFQVQLLIRRAVSAVNYIAGTARIRYEHHDAEVANATRTHFAQTGKTCYGSNCIRARVSIHPLANRVARFIVHVHADNTLEQGGSLVTGRRNCGSRNYACDENPVFPPPRGFLSPLRSCSCHFATFRLAQYIPGRCAPRWLSLRRLTAEWKRTRDNAFSREPFERRVSSETPVCSFG